MPAARKKRPTRGRQPLAATIPPSENQLKPNLIEIFNNSQHVATTDMALTQLKKLYKSTEFKQFEKPFRDCVRKLFQSKKTIYFKTSCEFLCKFLQHVSKLSDNQKIEQRDALTAENTAPNTRNRSSLSSDTGSENKRAKQSSSGRGTKRKAEVSDDEVDEILGLSPKSSPKKADPMDPMQLATVTDHDRVVSACIDVADMYMQVANEECRLNAVFFICKFLAYVESLDEEICEALKSTLPKRIRDRRPMIRAQAVLASRTFQYSKMTQDGFKHHFYRDPELVVRKALLQIMDTKVFGYDFLVDSTQDTHEVMRKNAYQRLSKVSPLDLSCQQLHRIIHNGLNERDRQASYFFKAHTLETWLPILYDGMDLYKLLEHFDVLNYNEDVSRLLEMIYEMNLDKIENNGATTKLHQVVESFRERWLNSDITCLPPVGVTDEKVITIWLTLAKFCKSNQNLIKPVRVRTLQPNQNQDDSIEKLLDSQERVDEVAELYERLTPDLVNLVDFVKRFVDHADKAIKNGEAESVKLEFIYQHLMQSILLYEIGDELERKTVQEVLGSILRENLLTGYFFNFIPPVIKCLFTLIYSSSSNLMINYISELINNVRSHLEDLAASTQQPTFAVPLPHSTIKGPSSKAVPKSTKKVRISGQIATRGSYAPDVEQNIELKIANIRLELEELKDKLDACVKDKDFDQAKAINSEIVDKQSELGLLHNRRCSIASDVSHMSMIVETEPSNNCKFSSTMIGDVSMDEIQTSMTKEEPKMIFKHHANELTKCLQMYFGCLQCVKIAEVPLTMLNHLTHLNYESLDDWYKGNVRVRSQMVACNGLTALVDKEFAKESNTMTLLISACNDTSSIEIRTVGFKSLVDVICRHEDIEDSVPMEKLEKFMNSSLRDYGKYNPDDMKKNELDFITALVEGTTRLYYFRRLASPRILSHLILWWYHPRTHSRLKQFIGVFLPVFVEDTLKTQRGDDDTWLKDLLVDTFVTSIEYLHDYILGPGFNMMAASDMHSLINFLCNLIPVSYHSSIIEKVDERIDELSNSGHDLLKYLRQSKNSLSCLAAELENTRNKGQ